MFCLIFSVVLYKSKFEDVANLISSIDKLNKYCLKYFPKSYKLEIKIIDNCKSKPFSFSKLNLKKFSLPITYKISERNLGYGSGHNQNLLNIKPTIHKWFIALNPDIYFKANEFIKFLEFIKNSKNISCAAPLIYLPNKKSNFPRKKIPLYFRFWLAGSRFFKKFLSLKNI